MLAQELREELRDIWTSIDALKAGQHEQSTLLAEIKTLLGERCLVRERQVETLTKDVREMRQRMWTISGAAAVAAFMAQRMWQKFWP